MPKALKKTLDITSTVLLVIFIIFVILLVGVRLVGIDPHIVLSGSMEPEIYTGSLVYVKGLSTEEKQSIEPGTTVTYLVDDRGTKVTHKIYNVVGPVEKLDADGNPILDANGKPTYAADKDGNIIIMYTTYGINNVKNGNVEGALDGDPEKGNLASSNIVGKPLFSIPLLGYVAHYVQNPPGRYVAYAVCLALIAMTFLSSTAGKLDFKGKKKGGEQPAEGEAVAEDQTPAEAEGSTEAVADEKVENAEKVEEKTEGVENNDGEN